MERLRQWAAGKNTSMPLLPDNSSSVDPVQIIAEENKVDDSRDEKKEKTEKRCRKDKEAGLKMIQQAKERLASEDEMCEVKQVYNTAQICLTNIKKANAQSKVDDLKTKISGAGWNGDVSSTQQNKWYAELEKAQNLVVALDRAILAMQANSDGCKSRQSEDKKKALERNAAASLKEAEQLETQTEESSELSTAKKDSADAEKAAQEQQERMENLKKAEEEAKQEVKSAGEEAKKKSAQQQLRESQRAAAASAKSEEAAKKAVASREAELQEKHKLEMASVSGKSGEEVQKMKSKLKKLQEEADKRLASQKADEQAAKAEANK